MDLLIFGNFLTSSGMFHYFLICMLPQETWLFLNLEGSTRKLIVKDPGDNLWQTVYMIISPLLRQVENLEAAVA